MDSLNVLLVVYPHLYTLLVFYIHINDLPNSTDNLQYILFENDTSVFVRNQILVLYSMLILNLVALKVILKQTN